jgi:acetyl-CoA carboxylase biotin carboxylase subunit
MILRRILIANRGEIAVRILATCERLGIETVLTASEVDLDSTAARLAGRTVCIGAAASAASYLNADAIVRAALASGADAVHPGYGFLSESPRLARACEAGGLVFIGPTATQLEAVGDKLEARTRAEAAGLPVLPGGAVRDLAGARALAASLGFPLLIKAVAGGGGRGMRPVTEPGQLEPQITLAVAEAQAAFGDPRLYLERFVRSARHVEVQLLGDGTRVMHLGDRDCSIQRRNQKLLEEAPAPGIGEALRSRMRAAAVRYATALGYRGAGTVEFLLDCEREKFHFIEMNARLQVEHPVTEAVTGLDLVAEQIAIAEGQPLSIARGDPPLAGHAIECRVNAEDWLDDFRPSPGTIGEAVFPAGPGIRVDTHVQAGSRVPPFYDSLLAKLIVHGRDRAEALARLRAALGRLSISGPATNIGLHRAIVQEPAFAAGGVDTAWLPALLARSDRRTRAHG